MRAAVANGRAFAALILASIASIALAASSAGFSLLEAPSDGYRGRVAENAPAGTAVSLSAAVRASSTSKEEILCRVDVVRHHGEIKVPFEVVVTDQYAGQTELRTTEVLDFEKQDFYSFQIEAISCSGTYAERAYVLVQVEDENEFSPEWPTDSLKLSVMEGESPSSTPLATLTATDGDGSRDKGEVCSYRLETEDQPFRVDERGRLWATAPLNYSSSHSYVLSVSAADCDGRRSEAEMLVVVEVRQRCRRRWNGISSVVSYVPGTGPMPLYPKAELEMCAGERAADLAEEEATCDPSSVKASVALHTSHIGKGCDRDTYSLWSQRRLCGANEEAVDMLPDKTEASNDLQQQQQHIKRDVGRASDASLTAFDGASGLAAPEEVQRMGDAFPGNKFTVATWMRHKRNDDVDKHAKEHIVCRADDHKKNRHHMALFVRNCKLVLLLRQEFQEGQENVFRPAEWRWKLPQVCDDEWHHYAVNVNFPDVQLIVDGDRWVEEKENPEVIDDWPLHNLPELNTRVTVGACWQGAESGFRHAMRGYLAGFSYVRGANENAEVLRCLQECAESLKVPAASAVAPGLEMVANGRGSKVVVDGPAEQVDGIAELVRQVVYLNTREFPAPGQRLLRLSTSVTCADGRILTLEDRRSTVTVAPMQEPKIQISGTDNIDREYEDFKLGVRIFADVHIVMTTGGGGDGDNGNGDPSGGEPVNGIENRLDSCAVTVSPPLNADHEAFEVPEDLLRSLQVVGRVDAAGAVFTGAEMIYNYERLLRQVTYTNKKPAYYLNRQFKIVCSELNGRFVSNEYSQTLTVVHPTATEVRDGDDDGDDDRASAATFRQPNHAHRALDEQSVDEVGFKQFALDRANGVAHNNVVAVVAVVFVAFLAVLLILGIVRVRATHQRRDFGDEEDAMAQRGSGAAAAGGHDAEMQWDDTALNITINPMEGSALGQQPTSVANESMMMPEDGLCSEDDEEEDEEESLYGEEEDDDEDVYVDEDELEAEAGHMVMVRPQQQSRKDARGAGGGGRGGRLEWDNHDI